MNVKTGSYVEAKQDGVDIVTIIKTVGWSTAKNKNCINQLRMFDLHNMPLSLTATDL